MPLIGKKKEIEQELILENIDPMVCKDKLKGALDPQGRCLIRVRFDPDKPDRAFLERLEVFPAPTPAPRKEKKEEGE